MKRTVAILLLFVLIFQCVPLASAEDKTQSAVYSSDLFTSCYANTLFKLLYAYYDGGNDFMDLETLTKCLWFNPQPVTKGTTVYYFSESNSVFFSAVYSDGIDEYRAADLLTITFQPQSGLSEKENKHVRMLLEVNLAIAISTMDGTDNEKVADFIDTQDDTVSVSSLMLNGGYVLTVAKNGSSYSYEMSRTDASSIPAVQSGTIYCPQCGQQIATGSKFCMYCGNAIPPVSSGSTGGNKPLPPTPTPKPAVPTWSSWSSWSTNPVYDSSTRQVETRTTVKGYNMFHYRTQFRDEPHPRVFRDYSINGDYDWKYSRKSYGEKYLEKYVTASELSNATVYYPDSKNVYNGKHPGYQDGTTIAYGFSDDEFMWFIASEVTVTEYRYRDMIG